MTSTELFPRNQSHTRSKWWKEFTWKRREKLTSSRNRDIFFGHCMNALSPWQSIPPQTPQEFRPIHSHLLLWKTSIHTSYLYNGSKSKTNDSLSVVKPESLRPTRLTLQILTFIQSSTIKQTLPFRNKKALSPQPNYPEISKTKNRDQKARRRDKYYVH